MIWLWGTIVESINISLQRSYELLLIITDLLSKIKQIGEASNS